MDKTKEFLENDINGNRDDVYAKIEDSDKRNMDDIGLIKERTANDKQMLMSLIEKSNDECLTILNRETEDLKTFVNSITSAG